MVLLIHEHSSMQLKELVAKFKPLMGGEKEDKAQFMAIVKKVATSLHLAPLPPLPPLPAPATLPSIST